jgi:hypothetical protein
MMTASMRMQDTLHNAVMSQRPPIMAKATEKADAEKTSTVDDLIDYQVFEEQPGEEIVGELADDFVNEGFYTAYVPWVKETRSGGRHPSAAGDPGWHGADGVFPRVPVKAEYPQGNLVPGKDGWDWTVIAAEREEEAPRFVFHTRRRRGGVEIEKDAIRYEGRGSSARTCRTCCIRSRCENLQIPGPSNPTGATHVILKDVPSSRRDQAAAEKTGYYDLMTQEDARQDRHHAIKDRQYEEREQQKDVMQGAVDWKEYPRRPRATSR